MPAKGVGAVADYSRAEMTDVKIFLETDEQTIAIGQQLAKHIHPPLTLYLTGELGAGKTTLSRGIIQALGHQGAVKRDRKSVV